MIILEIRNWSFVLFLLIAFSIFNNKAFANEINSDSLARRDGLTKIEGQQLIYILPSPRTDGDISVEAAMAARRSRRNFQGEAISAEQLSQILWAAYGITLPMAEHPSLRGGFRTTPSAGALFPLEIYAVVGNVEGLEPGVYRYISGEHKIIRVIDRDVRDELSQAALGQRMVREAPASVFFSAVLGRMTGVYGEQRGRRYIYMEIGHSAQNVYLQAEALGLGTCAVGAFSDDMVALVLELPAEEVPLYIMPVGHYR